MKEKQRLKVVLDKQRFSIWSTIGAFSLAGICSGAVALSTFMLTMVPLLNSHPVFSSALTLAIIACVAYASGRWGWRVGKKADKLALILCAAFALIPYMFVFYVVMSSILTISWGDWVD